MSPRAVHIWANLAVLAGGGVLCALYAGCASARFGSRRFFSAFFFFLFGSLFGFIGAKAVYAAANGARLVMQDGLPALFRMKPEEFSFVGLIAGTALGYYLVCAMCQDGEDVGKLFQRTAPAVALFAAFARFGEYFLGMLGLGYGVENEALAFFPLAVFEDGHPGDPLYAWTAIFMLEGAAALLVALILFIRRNRKPNRSMLKMAWYLCSWQLLLESMRSDSAHWGFVRQDQVLCAAVLLAIAAGTCIALSREQAAGFRKAAPVLAVAAAALMVTALEFIMDKTRVSHYLCWGLMLLPVLLLTATGILYLNRKKA